MFTFSLPRVNALLNWLQRTAYEIKAATTYPRDLKKLWLDI